MNSQLVQLYNTDGLDKALSQSFERLVVLFKHSVTCPISTMAHDEFRSYLKDSPGEVSHYMLTVQASRDVSNEIESRLGVRHESPQVIFVKDGSAVWNESHSFITSEKLRSKASKYSPAQETVASS